MSRRVIGWALVCVGLVLVVLAVVNGWNDIARSIPFTSQWRAARDESQLEVAQSDVKARTLESEGQAEQITRIESAGRLTIDVNTITAEAVQQSRDATDANDSLPAYRADTHAAHDRSLCDLRPAACLPAASIPAGTGDAHLSSPDPAG